MSALAHLVGRGLDRVRADVGSWASVVRAHADAQLVAALALAATAVAAYLVIAALTRSRSDLRELLQPYQLLPEPAEERPGRARAVTQPVVRHLADWLGGLVESRGLRPVLELRLLRAGLPVRPGEFLLACLGALVAAGGLGGLLGGPLGGLVGAAIGSSAPAAFVALRADRRLRSFNAQLPDLLKLTAGSLRAGFSLLQSLGSVVEQVEEPMQSELRLALSRARLGESIEDALGEVAERTGSREFEWTVTAVGIQREVGGNLAEILDTVATTMVERERLRREVRTLTAEGRMSAIILALLPLALGGFIFLANRPYIELLVSTTPGELALAGGVLLELLGGWWMRRTIEIEV